jgi:hypothetical protein
MTDNSIEQIVDEMTLAEQVALLSGEDFCSGRRSIFAR